MANPLTQAAHQVAANLVDLTKTYESSDPTQSGAFRRAFKEQSKNDLSRIVVYLLELVGSRDVQFKYLTGENNDLKELLKLNGIDPDKEIDETAAVMPQKEENNEKTS